MTNTVLESEIIVTQRYLHELQIQHWLQFELFSYQWWALIVVLIVPWIIWWKLVDKKRTAIILAYGIYILFVVSEMDAVGLNMGLWLYPISLIPMIPGTEGIDWGLLPVLHMLIYQYFPKWKSFFIAETVISAVLAFAGEPLGEWLGVYLVLHWYHIWSLPIYVMKAVLGKWLIESIVYRR